MPSRSTRRGTPDYDLLRLALLEQEQNTQPGRTPSALSMNAYLGGMPETYEQGRQADMLGEMDRRYFQSREDDRKRRGLVDDAKAQATVRGFQTRTGVEEGESAYPSAVPATGVRTIRRFGDSSKPIDADAARSARQVALDDPRVLAAEASGRSAIEAARQRAVTTAGNKPPTGADRNTLNYFRRMLEAEKSARAVEDKLSTTRDLIPPDVPMVPEIMENFIRTPEGQSYTQAQRMFTEARLRKESGAAIPENEFINDRRMNFRMPGDTPKTITQKRKARLETMRGIGNASGKALKEFYGDDADLNSILQELESVSPTTPAGLSVGTLGIVDGVPAIWDGQNWVER